MLTTPCEVVVKEVLPAIRAMIVIELRERGMKQKEIARKLGLTQPAVSYYLNKRRAKKIQVFKSEHELTEKVNELVDKIIKNEISWSDLSKAFCMLCSIARERIYGIRDGDTKNLES
ncbi:MAG: transcriptional regulator [Candidatus Njordarchaeia archaeon]